MEEKVAEGVISVPKAAALGQILAKPELQKPGEDLLALAAEKTTREVVNFVRERKEEVRTGESPTPRTIFLSSKGLLDLGRTRNLAGGKKGRPVSESEAVETALDDYVERHDPERKLARSREKPCAERRPEPNGAPNRYIPAAEKHAVVARGGDRCFVAGCDERAFLQFAHRTPFRLSGESVASNLARACVDHHRQIDAGIVKVVQGRDGAILVNRAGTVVGRLRAQPPP